MQITYSNLEILNVVIPLTCFRAYQTYALFLKTLHVWQDYSKYIRDLVFFSFFSFSCQLFTTFRERLLILITFEQNCFFSLLYRRKFRKTQIFQIFQIVQNILDFKINLLYKYRVEWFTFVKRVCYVNLLHQWCRRCNQNPCKHLK